MYQMYLYCDLLTIGNKESRILAQKLFFLCISLAI